jgi:hypothetical protein
MKRTIAYHHPFDVLEPRSLLGADLALTLGAITITDPGTAAEIIHVSTNVHNVGDAQYASGGGIHYFLSSDASLGSDDFSWETRPLGVFNPGDNSTFSFDATRPPASATLPAGNYFVIATFEFPAGIHDDFAGNNVAQTAETLNIPGAPPPPPPTNVQFGNVNGQQVAIHETLANGQHATFAIEGHGTGTLTNTNGQFSVTLDGSDNRSTLIVRADSANDHPVLNGITINGDAQRIRLNHVAVNGNITVNGSLREFNGDDITGGTFLITSATRATDIRVHDLTDVTINSASTIKTLALHNWSLGDANVRDAVLAPSLEHLNDRGDFGADLAISGVGARRDSLKNVDIRGNISGGTWIITGNAGDVDVHNIAGTWAANITGDLKSLRVRGDAAGLLAAHNIKTMDFKHNVTGMMVLAGANLGSDAHLAGTGTAADTFTGGTIKDINIRGNFTNSTIAAGVNPTNTAFGDTDDVFLSPSKINHARVRGTTTNSSFIAASVNNKRAHHEDHDNDNHGGGNNQGDAHDNGTHTTEIHTNLSTMRRVVAKAATSRPVSLAMFMRR